MAQRLLCSRAMRHFVPTLALALLALPGCYLMHEEGGERCALPPGQVCCAADGFPLDGTPPTPCPFTCPSGSRLTVASACGRFMPPPGLDGGPVPPPPPPTDGGVDAGLMCAPVRADATCLSSWLAPPRVAFALPVSFDACGCCAETECAVDVATVDGTPTLRLTTTMCPDPCDCDACVRPSGSCAVPPLEEGLYDVVVNGAWAFRLPVFDDPGFVPPPAACARYAEDDPCSPSAAMPPFAGYHPSRVCVEPGPDLPDRTTITLGHDCWGCGDLHGPCEVIVEPRFTDDLPPGGEIRVSTTRFPTACEVDCPAICIADERRCEVPPLEPGHFYRVWVDGDAVLSFTNDGSVSTCTDTPVPPG